MLRCTPFSCRTPVGGSSWVRRGYAPESGATGCQRPRYLHKRRRSGGTNGGRPALVGRRRSLATLPSGRGSVAETVLARLARGLLLANGRDSARGILQASRWPPDIRWMVHRRCLRNWFAGLVDTAPTEAQPHGRRGDGRACVMFSWAGLRRSGSAGGGGAGRLRLAQDQATGGPGESVALQVRPPALQAVPAPQSATSRIWRRLACVRIMRGTAAPEPRLNRGRGAPRGRRTKAGARTRPPCQRIPDGTQLWNGDEGRASGTLGELA